MNMHSFRILVLTLLTVVFVVGCQPDGARCRKCGMLVDEHPRWIAGAVDADGQEARFCCPRCLFAWSKSPRGEGVRDPWVTEYYHQKRTPINEVFLVMGSDLTGPMGKALVPVADRAAAEQFLKDHAGTHILSAAEVTTNVLKELAARNP